MRFTGSVQKATVGHLAVLTSDEGIAYRINPLGKSDAFYCENAAGWLAERHAEYATKHGIVGMNVSRL